MQIFARVSAVLLFWTAAEMAVHNTSCWLNLSLVCESYVMIYGFELTSRKFCYVLTLCSAVVDTWIAAVW